jgi:hypothetical protein
VDDYITISKVESGLDHILSGLILDSKITETVHSASAVILPWVGRPEHSAPVFQSGTRELYRYLQRNIPEGLNVEVASSEEGYEELTEHADLWVFPAIFIAQNPTAVTVILNLLSNYIYDRIKTLLPGRKAEVKIEILLAQKNSLVSIKYKGPAESFEKIVQDTVSKNLIE